MQKFRSVWFSSREGIKNAGRHSARGNVKQNGRPLLP